jgi:hypothetical protein
VGEYLGDGEHFGLGNDNASGGSTVDDHSIIPTGFRYELADDATEYGTWMMWQQYGYWAEATPTGRRSRHRQQGDQLGAQGQTKGPE